MREPREEFEIDREVDPLDEPPAGKNPRGAPARQAEALDAQPRAALGSPARSGNNEPPEETAESNDEEWEESPPRRGCFFWLTLVLLAVAALSVAGYVGIKKLLERTAIGRLDTVYHTISLLPSPQIQPEQTDVEVKIFYAVRGRGLSAEVRRLPKAAEGDERAHLIARELMLRPQTGLLEQALPAGTTLRGVFVQNGIVIVDLSAEFARPALASPSGERLAVYAIVDSFLLNDATLKGVRILIDGKAVTTAWGWLDLTNPLTADVSLIE